MHKTLLERYFNLTKQKEIIFKNYIDLEKKTDITAQNIKQAIQNHPELFEIQKYIFFDNDWEGRKNKLVKYMIENNINKLKFDNYRAIGGLIGISKQGVYHIVHQCSSFSLVKKLIYKGR